MFTLYSTYMYSFFPINYDILRIKQSYYILRLVITLLTGNKHTQPHPARGISFFSPISPTCAYNPPQPPNSRGP